MHNAVGDPTQTSNKWYGYPTCFTVWQPSVFSGSPSLKTGDQFIPSPNSTFADQDCSQHGSTAPALSLPAHSAPITNLFDQNGTNMYVTLHGSWNRSPAIGYSIVQIPFTKNASSYTPVAASNSMTGFNTVVQASNPGSCNSPGLQQSSCWRLAALAWDPANTRLFFSSDNSAEGEIFIVWKK
jgi:hypothetical protein